MEVGGNELTIYDNLDPRTGEKVWGDLCRGPHIPTTKHIPAFKLTRSSAAYWRGNQDNADLQRIYGTAWESTEALEQHLELLAEAERRDHRKLGSELDLFSFPDELGSGLPVFHPRGGIIRTEMEDYSRKRHVEEGYEFVNTPHITKGHLYEVSGHLDWYRDGMFPAMHIDEELNEDGTVRKPGQDYYLKPMNCPMHNLIFRSRGRSYRELPLRLFEFGSVYRYEKSGVVHGLTRVRGMTQDDAHIYCTREQMRDELATTLQFVLGLLKDYGLDDFYLELSTKNPDKFVGDDAVWEEATATLAEVAESSGLNLVPDPGGAAFYGPKISVQVQDALGRTWQMSTIQLDFNLPERFDLEYTGQRRHQAAAGHDPPRAVRFHRTVLRRAHRALRGCVPGVAGARPGGRYPGRYSPRPYYLRITKPQDPDDPASGPDPNAGTLYGLGDNFPRQVDQREIVDNSFLGLVLLGIKPWDDQTVLNSLRVADETSGENRIAVDTPSGRVWRRFTFDGYGEQRDGALWDILPEAQGQTLGRAWPLLAGERGEYDLIAGRRATAALRTMANTANDGLMLPEQVWDNRPPAGSPGAVPGQGTRSATPLAWTHAQFVRLAWSIQAGEPIERPSVVACRYVGTDC